MLKVSAYSTGLPLSGSEHRAPDPDSKAELRPHSHKSHSQCVVALTFGMREKNRHVRACGLVAPIAPFRARLRYGEIL